MPDDVVARSASACCTRVIVAAGTSVVVVGGGASSAGDLFLEPARRSFVDSVEAPEHRPEVPILPAELGNDAGAIGAADLARAAAVEGSG